MLNDRSQAQKTINLHAMSRKGKCVGREQISVYFEPIQKLELTVNGPKQLLGMTKMSLHWIVVMVTQFYKFTKIIELLKKKNRAVLTIE